MKNNKLKNLILILAIAAIAVCGAAVCVACNDNSAVSGEVTVAFYDGDKLISSVSGNSGDSLTAPTAEQLEKSGYTFAGWYDSKALSGEPITLPSVIPQVNAAYYAKYTVDAGNTNLRKVIYELNLVVPAHGGDVAPSVGMPGETVQLKDGRDFYVGGYRFMGWTEESTYVYSVDKPFAPYLAGESYTIKDSDVTLYAQWAAAYLDAKDEDSGNVIYVFEPLVGHGKGAAIYSSKGKPDVLGFVTSADDSQSGYKEFTFNIDDNEFTGRLNDDKTYSTMGNEAGTYLYYDYVIGDTDKAIGGAYLALDGYGYAVCIEQLGSQTVVRMSGYYEYDPDYDDYLFEYIDSDNEKGETHFALTDGAPTGTEFDGLFLFQGLESGAFILYDNGELLYDTVLMLNGYGYAEVYAYDGQTEQLDKISSGSYYGTAAYEGYTGEWRYRQEDGTYVSFYFIVSALNSGSDIVPIYIEYNSDLDVTLTAVNGSDTLYLDGYGMAMYKSSGVEYVGECTVSKSGKLITFVPRVEDENGNVTAGGTMYFNVDLLAGTFTMNTEGFVIDGTTLTGYTGTSQIVEIPTEITEIGDNAFNYVNTDVSLISVTISAGVTSIGARAFQNNHTLRRAVFLSETPIAISFASDGNPFRWPAGDFVIVVPEGTQDAYKAAWSDCPYAIKGSVEVTLLPEFEIDDGVLVRYNKQPNTPELIDIKIPDDVTKIAANVFIGVSYIRSVDLNNVIEIGETAFYGCENLVTVKFTKVKIIGDGAFGDCILLSSSGEKDVIDLPAITDICDTAFSGCISLRRVVLGENIASIGGLAFRECNIFESDPPLFVVLTGSDVPQMGEKITVGNIAFRIEVSNIDVAIKCFTASGWNSYCKHLYIQSGDEKGKYISGSDTLEIDGRAVYQSSETWLYAIDGESITFYLYDSETATYSSFVGTIKDGVITVKVHGEGATRTFKSMVGLATYTTADGKYTLVCNPQDFDPENYDGYKGYCDVTFNGKQMQMYVSGYNSRTISGFVGEDGLTYTVNIDFDGDTLVVTLTRNELIANIKATDGSVLNIHYLGNNVYVYGDFMIKVGTNADGSDRFLSFTEISGITASVQGNTYTFTFKFLNTSYQITATISADGKTFTYTYTVPQID